MKLVKHTKYIYEYENFIEKKLCDDIISLVISSNFYNEYKAIKSRVRHNSCINLTEISSVDDSIKKVDNLVHKVISTAHQIYLSDNKLFSFVPSYYFSNLKSDYIYRYYDEYDYYDWHLDTDINKYNVLSYLIYLNDDFKGGDTLFLNDGIKVKPKCGSILCFPCDIQTLHKSSRITKGKKNVIWTCLSRGTII